MSTGQANSINVAPTSSTVVAGNGTIFVPLAYTASNTNSTIVSRDVHGTSTFVNIVTSVTSTVSSGQTINLTSASTGEQVATGSATIKYVLPDATTLYSNQTYNFNNNSTANITVYLKDGTTLLATIVPGAYIKTINTNNGSTNGTWDYHWVLPSSAVYGTAGLAVTGQVSATTTMITGYATTATAAATTTLVATSAQQQYFTGSTTQTVLLPVVSTLVLGQSFVIVNNSSGVVTVQSSGANSIQAMAANTQLVVNVISTSGTTAASWNAVYSSNTLAPTAISTLAGSSGSATGTTVTLSPGSTGLTYTGSSATLTTAGTLAIANGGTAVTSVTIVPTATSFAGWDANSNLSANAFIAGYATTATAAGTTTLLVGSAQQQFFTGSTTQTVLMPVVSTLVLGQTFEIVNNSSGVVTVKSSGANTIKAMAASTNLVLTVIAITGTTAASWSIDYTGSGLPGIVTLTGNVGSATGNNVTLASASANGTLIFSGTGSTLSLTTFDGDFNIGLGGNNNFPSEVTTQYCVALGFNCLFASTDSFNHVAIGKSSLFNILTGTNSICIGTSSGINYVGSESSNILFSNPGVAAESNVLRIGAGTGSSSQQLNKAFISGINGVTSANPAIVTTNTSTDQMGTMPYVLNGTFTPTLIGDSVAGTTTYTVQSGFYTRIGNMVFVQATITITGATGIGNMILQGLPLTVNSNTNYYPPGSVVWQGSAGWTWPVGATSIAIYANPVNSSMYVYASGTAILGGQIQMANAALSIQYSLAYTV